MKIIIDPRVEYRYSSYYRLGLYRLLGRSNISYSTVPFKDLSCENKDQFGCGLQFIADNEEGVRKNIYLDIKDVAPFEQDKYDWADVYGKVNIPEDSQNEYHLADYPKMVALGPNFGLRNRNALGLAWLALKCWLKGKAESSVSWRLYLQSYLYPYIRRRSLDVYERPCKVRPDYIFHASTLWYNDFAASDTNRFRGGFLKACQRAGLKIEGGLFYVDGQAPLREMPDYPKYKEIYRDFIYDKRLSMDDYIQKTKESVLVFNTPSVLGCLGWKLGEYLCMGKAIISTPLNRVMPGDGLVHGKNVHFVKTEEEIYDAIVKITTDKAYRQRLERGAREYYEKWLAPEIVVKRILDIAFG